MGAVPDQRHEKSFNFGGTSRASFEKTRVWKENPSEKLPKKQGVFRTICSLELKKSLVKRETLGVSLVFAHRGAHLVARENTLEAFRDAVALGVDGVELDVRRSADGALVVHHDPSVKGHVIAQTNAQHLPDYVPRLSDAMKVLQGVTVNVEVKNLKDPNEPTYDDTGTFAREVLDALSDEHQSSVALSCFDLATCEALRAFSPDVYIGWLIWRTSLSSSLQRAKERGFNAVNPHFRLLSRGAQREAAELGLDLNVWTVNRTKDLRTMAALGVASVITDQPGLALQLRDESS
jgi:glycerophosphoryl diester phosphodiesterase